MQLSPALRGTNATKLQATNRTRVFLLPMQTALTLEFPSPISEFPITDKAPLLQRVKEFQQRHSTVELSWRLAHLRRWMLSIW